MRTRVVAIAIAAWLWNAPVARAEDVRLADAAERRDATAVTALLKAGATVNGRQADGASALHWAAHWNDLAMLKALLRAGAAVNVANDYGVTPLFLAATNGSSDGIDALVAGGADPNAARPEGETVLMTAVRSGRVAAVERLLKAGANPNRAQASKGQTALMWAASGNHPEIAAALISAGAQVNVQSSTGFTPLMFAAREGQVAMARTLLDAGADVNAASTDGSTALLVATVRGHAVLALALLERGAKADGDPNAGYTPLHWACLRYEHPFSAETGSSADVEPPGEWRAMAGIPDRAPKLALINALLERGANVEALVKRPMPSPTRFGGGSPRVGATPFMVAATAGDAELMRLLLKKGAKADVRTEDGATALMAIIAGGNAFAAKRVTEQNRIEAIQVALDAGIDLEAQDSKGYRAMHNAASSEFHGIIKFLLSKGADLNPVTKTRREKEGAGFVVIAGQSPLGVVEGTFLGGSYNERPETAAFLRTLGAKSIGRATLETYLKSFEVDPDRPASDATKPPQQ